MTNAICIQRLYGSGGRAIGDLLAKKLNYKFYDRKLIEIIARESRIPIDQVERNEENYLNPWLYISSSQGFYIDEFQQSQPAQIQNIESDIIKNKAKLNNSVFVGRSAEAILKSEKDIKTISLYIYAPEEWRIKRLIKTENFKSETEAFNMMKKIDKRRINFADYFFGLNYIDPVNYDLCINSSILGIEKTADILFNYIKTIV